MADEALCFIKGSRSISLSLNRTFVLPETPRSIDLQLQGDDLVDICEFLFSLGTIAKRFLSVRKGHEC